MKRQSRVGDPKSFWRFLLTYDTLDGLHSVKGCLAKDRRRFATLRWEIRAAEAAEGE